MQNAVNMPGTHRLTTEVHFCAAHQLRGYVGNCAQLHGHNYRVIVEVLATQLDEIGLGMDFREIRKGAEAVALELDHRFLNELAPFDRVNPSAENIASYFFEKLAQKLDRPGARVSAITIWETERCSVRYEA
jgi:6-pyruvoyltetrahydropterin/6-carboxytetrahydropterin synthase